MFRMKLISPVLLLFFSISAFGDDEGVVEEAEEDPYLYTEKNFDGRLDSESHFVMFYAPWCGHCKRLIPVWQELADFYNSKTDRNVAIAKVDCTADAKICSDNAVTGYPTIKLFPIGKEPVRFRGGRDLESLKDFVTKTLTNADEDEKEDKDVPPLEVNEGLYEISSENFDNHIASGNHFIKFFAPWCGHCKKMEPAWKELAENFKNSDRVKIGNVDCTKNSESCKANEVRGYPTLLWFRDGKKVEKYQGSRQLENFIEFTEKMLSSKAEEDEEQEEAGKQAEEQEQEPEPKGALELDADSFKETIALGVSFVKFYAPWCGHCKRLAPTWDELSREDFSTINRPVRIVKVDCTKSQSLCAEYEVRGYPTLKLFIEGEEKEKYSGARNLESLKEYLLRISGTDDQQKDEL